MVLSTLTIASVTPRGAVGGSSITIVGQNFGPPTGRVVFNPDGGAGGPLDGTITSWTPTQIVCTTPVPLTVNRFVLLQVINAAANDQSVIPFWIPFTTPGPGDTLDYQYPKFEAGSPTESADDPFVFQAADFNRSLDRVKALGGAIPGPPGNPGAPGVGSPGPPGSPGSITVIGVPGPPGTAGQSFVWKGPWSALTTYAKDDVVRQGGAVYIALATNNNDPPPSINWDLFVPAAAGVFWRGNWAFALNYATNDIVHYIDGNTYIAVANNTGVIPPAVGIWELFTSKGDQGIQGAPGPSGGPPGATGLQGNQGNAGPAGATSNAGFRPVTVVPANVQGAQSFVVNTPNTPIATDRVMMFIDGWRARAGTHFTVSIVVGVSFTVNWLGVFDLTSVDDVEIDWFTTPP
jgi:hypothetical protein